MGYRLRSIFSDVVCGSGNAFFYENCERSLACSIFADDIVGIFVGEVYVLSSSFFPGGAWCRWVV